MRSPTLSLLATLVALHGLAGCDKPQPDTKPDTAAKSDAKPDAAKPDAGKPDAAIAEKPDTEKPDAGKPDAAKPDAAVAEKRAAAKQKIAGVDDAELAKRKAEMLASLNEGRKLVKSGDVEGGIAKYEALLKIAPNYGPALGELGWAEFKAGKLDDAHAHSLRALAAASEPNKRGMLLYNLGKIAEARGQTQAAIDHYQASLAARPNDVVAKQLASLQPEGEAPMHMASAGEGEPSEPAAEGPGLGRLGSDLANVDALCELARRDSMCGEDASCTLVATPEGGGGHGMLELDDMGMVRCWLPVVATPSGSQLFDAAAFGQHGSEIDEGIDSVASKVVSNAAGKFLVITFSDHAYERVWSDLEADSEELPDWNSTDREAVIFCRIEGEVACTAAITTRDVYLGENGDSASYSAVVDLVDDQIVVSSVVGTAKRSITEGYAILEPGHHAFADLAKP